MVKLKHKGLLVLGVTRHEMEQLREGRPLDIPLADVGLKGQRIMVIPGEDNMVLKNIMEDVARAYENGATSPIEIAKVIPKKRLQ